MYNKDSDSLNAGAPDIRLSGNQRMASYGFDEAMAESRQAYDDARKKGVIPIDMEFEDFLDLMREGGFLEGRAPQQDSGIMAAAPGTYTQNRKRQMAAGGGIAGLEKRQGYFLGDLVDKIKDDLIPNELKNPLTAAILGGGLANYVDLAPDVLFGEGATTQDWLGNLLGNIPGVSNVVSKELGRVAGDLDINNPNEMKNVGKSQFDDGFRKALATVLPFGDPGYVQGGLYNTILGGGDGITGMFSSAASPYLGEGEGRRVNPLYPLGIGAAVGKYVEGLPKDTLPMDTTSIDPAAIAAAARGTDAEGIAAGLRFLPEQVTRAAQGGRIGYQEGGIPNVPEEFLEDLKRRDLYKFLDKYRRFQDDYKRRRDLAPTQEAAEGGLMNLGGMEKDYRNEGGFVALGGEEKADDVPARLSKNEFVFTADAVRGAGGGDIDKGAEIMEDLMNNLEGARGMFANAQKLQNRII